MKRLLLAAVIVAVPGASRASCDGLADIIHNINRSAECAVYTTDWNKRKDLGDVRQSAIADFIQRQPGGADALELVIRDANIIAAKANGRDVDLWPDDAMWSQRGCSELRACAMPRIAETVPLPEPKAETVDDTYKPVKKKRAKRKRSRNYDDDRYNTTDNNLDVGREEKSRADAIVDSLPQRRPYERGVDLRPGEQIYTSPLGQRYILR